MGSPVAKTWEGAREEARLGERPFVHAEMEGRRPFVTRWLSIKEVLMEEAWLVGM